MAIARTGWNQIYTTAVEDPVSASLALGANAGRAAVGFMSVGTAYAVSSAGITSGDALSSTATAAVDGFDRYGFAGLVTQTGSQTVTFDTDAPAGQLKWGAVASYEDVASIRSIAIVSGASGTNPSATVTTVAGDMVVLLGISAGATASISAAGGATDFDGGAADTIALEKIASGASTTINGTWSGASAWYAVVAVLVPVAAPAPVLTSPSGLGGSLTGIGRVTSDVAGTLYFRATATSTPATVPAYPGAMTGWSSQAMTVGANSAPFGALAAGTWFPQFAADDGSGNRTAAAVVGGSFVVTAAPATARPGADVTTAGWTPSTGVSFAGVVDEAAPDDADYLISPTLGPSTAPVTLALDTVLAVGTWSIGVRARTTSGTGTVRVYLLNDANTVVGTSGLQAINSTFTTYTLPVTTTGLATRARIETLAT